MNRLDLIADKLTGGPFYNMKMLLNTITPSSILPQVDKYYVFIYKAKSPNIIYDRHPFIQCTSIAKWGFTGFNYHWNNFRRYGWGDLESNLYEVRESEIGIVMSADLAKFMRT